MNPKVIAVKAQDDYKILLTFTNNEMRVFDMRPYIDKGFFKQLQDRSYFNNVKQFMDSMQWQNGQDLCFDTLYLDSEKVN